MNNIYYVKIGDHNWVRSHAGHVALIFGSLPNQLVVTDDLDKAEVFHYLASARRVAKAFGGTIYAPKGKLAPVNDEEEEK